MSPKFYFPVFLFFCFAVLCPGQDDDQADGAKSDPEAKADEKEPDNRPNIVLIIADDMAWDDSSPYGHPTLPTPNLQRLADEGMRFEKAFVTISSCSPSRASIITGQYPTTTDADELHWPLPEDKFTFVEMLKSSGYWTGAAGKWHLGEAMKSRFDSVLEVDTSGFQLPTGKDAKSGKFKETLSGEAQSGCADWIKLINSREKDKPFFLWLAALDPHRPYHPNINPSNFPAADVQIPPYHPDTPGVRADYQLYYEEIIRLDRYVGVVIDHLKEQGVDGNTMICFFSDNGRPFPRDKTTLYDSGIRTPFLVRWPDIVEPGSVCRELVSTVDIARTALSIARIENITPNFKGRSFLPQLVDASKPGREYVFAEKNWHDFEDHARAVRNKRYKYIRNYYDDLPLTPPADAVRCPTYLEMKRLGRESRLLPHQLTCFMTPRDKEELYDTETDPFELRNLAGEERFSSILEAMRSALKSWELTHDDSPPELRTADEFDRITGLPTKARVRPRRSKADMVKANLTAP